MVYAIVTIGVLQVIFDVIGLWLAWKLHGQSSRRIAIVERENVHLAGGIVKAQKVAETLDKKISSNDISLAALECECVRLSGDIANAQKADDAGHVEMKSYLAQAWAEEEKFRIDAIAEEDAKIEGLNQRLLTLENKQQKIAPRPKRVNFREFRDAAERASEPEEAE